MTIEITKQVLKEVEDLYYENIGLSGIIFGEVPGENYPVIVTIIGKAEIDDITRLAAGLVLRGADRVSVVAPGWLHTKPGIMYFVEKKMERRVAFGILKGTKIKKWIELKTRETPIFDAARRRENEWRQN